MGKSVDYPGSLVVASEGVRIACHIVGLRREKAKVCRINKLEDMLSPSDKVLPGIDIIPYIG